MRRRRVAWTLVGPSGWPSRAPHSPPLRAVSLAGPIGFIGTSVPHLVRLMVGGRSPDRPAGLGALWRGVPRVCDLAARMLLAPLETVGVVTAMLEDHSF